MFYRKIEPKLYKYYDDKKTKILVVNGVRQIGKSFIIRETVNKHFKNYVEINLKYDYDGEQLFSNIKQQKISICKLVPYMLIN